MGPLTWIDRARKLVNMNPGNIARITRLYEAQPKIAQVYSPQAVSSAIERTEPKQVVMMRPDEFRSLAQSLSANRAAPYVKHYADLVKAGKWVEPDDPNIYLQSYLDEMRQTPFEGFSDVPFLMYRQDPTSAVRGQIMGHEGRHRNMVLDQLFPGEAFPVRFFRGDRTDELPLQPQQVYPEGSTVNTRPWDLTGNRRFAKGGPLRMITR